MVSPYLKHLQFKLHILCHAEYFLKSLVLLAFSAKFDRTNILKRFEIPNLQCILQTKMQFAENYNESGY